MSNNCLYDEGIAKLVRVLLKTTAPLETLDLSKESARGSEPTPSRNPDPSPNPNPNPNPNPSPNPSKTCMSSYGAKLVADLLVPDGEGQL